MSLDVTDNCMTPRHQVLSIKIDPLILQLGLVITPIWVNAHWILQYKTTK
ncbi:hypothetical protein TcasGA2_TC032562 [Tribolium castaneum]|uniref:Uncharacterized protein n=1 Tax=Tribolium castaneum TaxID=7070 RepID=A0A139WKC5_TRICA|nr:hypothetical protein TcasGA2_TC032562 [Tribolium castaneum]